jgi:hypothetical protein
MGAGAENAMKTPSFLLLLAAAALASPAAAIDPPPHRCKVDALKALPADAVIDGAKAKELCDDTVWHYLGHFAPVPNSQKTALVLNDKSLDEAWAKGLGDQVKILTDVDDHYQRADALGLDALAKADDVTAAAVKSGVAARKDGAALSGLKAAGLTGDAYAAKVGYEVSPAAPAADAAPVPVADLTAAFSQLVQDPKPAPVKKGEKAKPAPAVKEVKPGAGVLAFRKSVVALANEVKSSAKKAGEAAKAAYKDTEYEAALKFLTDPNIAKGDDDSPRDGAALSKLDFGLRNLIALRAAAVDQAFASAKSRLSGRSVSEALAAAKVAEKNDPRLPANQSSKDLAAAVTRHLAGVQDYAALSKLYDDTAAKGDTPERVLLANQLKSMRDDASKAVADKTVADDGHAVKYAIGGKLTDAGIKVADLDKSKAYRETIAEAIAQNIATNPLSAEVQAAVAALGGKGDSGTVVTPPLKPGEQQAADKLPPVKVEAPRPSWDEFSAAHQAGCAFLFIGCKGSAERAVADQNEANSKAAHDSMVRLQQLDSAAEAAGSREERLRVDGRKAVESNKDPEINKDAALAAYDAETKQRASKATADFKASHKDDYAAEASAGKAREDSVASLNETIDAAYSSGISQAIDGPKNAPQNGLIGLYKTADTDQRRYAESKSGYTGAYYDQYAVQKGRVDSYFTANWGGDKRAGAVEACKAALGFKKGGDSGNFKDPSVENVDKYCGPRDPKTGIAPFLASFKGKQMPAAPVPDAKDPAAK